MINLKFNALRRLSMYNFYNLNPNHLSPESSNQVTVDINLPLHNDMFYELFNTYTSNPTVENQDKLGNYLNTIQYLIGFFPNDDSDVNTTQLTLTKNIGLNLLICSTPERDVYLPTFTSTAELRKWSNESINTLSVPAMWLWKFVLSQNNFTGIVFNPGSIGWTINYEHIRSLLEDITLN